VAIAHVASVAFSGVVAIGKLAVTGRYGLLTRGDEGVAGDAPVSD